MYETVVDLGNGTPAATFGPVGLPNCNDSGDWPVGGSSGFGWSGTFRPGTYTLTITIHSENCSGGDQQETTVTKQLTVG